MAAEGKVELRALGAMIRTERKKLDISQEDFAELCDVHRTYISQVERGEKNISFISVLRIAHAFRTQPSLLFRKAGL
jgi:transcriptional regulator with XRE-family HTH domain